MITMSEAQIIHECNSIDAEWALINGESFNPPIQRITDIAF